MNKAVLEMWFPIYLPASRRKKREFVNLRQIRLFLLDGG